MLTIMTALALAAAAQTAPAAAPANPHAQHGQQAPQGQADHPKMDHSKMESCCKKGADGKMECAMHDKAGAGSAHQGHSGN